MESDTVGSEAIPAGERSGRLSGRPRVPLVGRSEDLEGLEQHFTAVCAGSPRAVLVEGPAGIGKTSLLRSFLDRHPSTTVRWSTGDELEADLPFGVAAQMLGLAPSDLRDAGGALEVGSRMLQALSDRETDSEVIVVVDDAGWADVPSLQAMSFALRRLEADRVLVLLTCRSELVAHLPAGLVSAVEANGQRVELTGLDRAALADLVAALGRPELSSRTLRRLAEHTRGNPQYFRALLGELSPDALAAGDSAPLPAPRSYSDTVVDQLAAMNDATLRLVAAAAVLGLHAPAPLIAGVADLDAPAAAIDEAVAAGVLETEPKPLHLELRFTHPLLRAAVYHQTPLSTRAVLHGRAAELSADRLVALRHRAAAVTGHDDSLAKELTAAGEGAFARPAGSTAAAGWFHLAARLTSDANRREDLVLRAMQALVQAGDAAAAADLSVVLAGFRDSPRKRYLQATLTLSRGDNDAAVSLLLRAWDAYGVDSAPELRSWIAADLAVAMINTARLDDALLWAGRATARAVDGEARPAGPSPTSPYALIPVALAAAGRFDEALAVAEPVPAEGHTLDDSALARLTGRGASLLWADDLHGAHRDLRRAAEASRQAGGFLGYAVSTCYLADVEYRLGDWDGAMLHAELISSLAEDLGQSWFLALPSGIAALPAANRGDWATAERCVAASLAAADTIGDASTVMWARTAQATLAAARGDHAAAVAAGLACLEHPGVRSISQIGVRYWRIIGAEACAVTGEHDLADRFLDVTHGEFPTPALAIARTRAQLAIARGDDDEADRQFAEAYTHAPRCADPYHLARLHLAHGAHLRRQGERRSAVDGLLRARTEFERLRAAPWLERVDRELAACGQRPRTPREFPDLKLTPQEQAVAQLVTLGRRNREIATELFISVKTVEYHLGNAYRKLGVGNRTQLAATFRGPAA